MTNNLNSTTLCIFYIWRGEAFNCTIKKSVRGQKRTKRTENLEAAHRNSLLNNDFKPQTLLLRSNTGGPT